MHLASRFACTGSQLIFGNWLWVKEKKLCIQNVYRHEKIKLINWKYLALLAVKKNEYTPPIQNVYRHENTKLVNWK